MDVWSIDFDCDVLFAGNSVFESETLIWGTFYGLSLAMESKGKIMSDKLRRAFVFFACIAFMSNLYTNRETIIHSRYLRIAEPVPLLLSDHYTKYWVFTNVANDGSIK